MEILNTYFDTLVFYWMEEKQGQAIYVAAVSGMLGGDKMRCIIAFVPAHLGIVSKSKLRDLHWNNLQMRSVPRETYKTNIQAWKAPFSKIPDITLKVIDRGKIYSTCVSITPGIEFPFEILLIHSPKKNSIYQYPNTMNLHWAIDQFATVFNLQNTRTDTIVPTYNDINVSSTINTINNSNTNNIEWI